MKRKIKFPTNLETDIQLDLVEGTNLVKDSMSQKFYKPVSNFAENTRDKVVNPWHLLNKKPVTQLVTRYKFQNSKIIKPGANYAGENKQWIKVQNYERFPCVEHYSIGYSR